MAAVGMGNVLLWTCGNGCARLSELRWKLEGADIPKPPQVQGLSTDLGRARRGGRLESWSCAGIDGGECGENRRLVAAFNTFSPDSTRRRR